MKKFLSLVFLIALMAAPVTGLDVDVSFDARVAPVEIPYSQERAALVALFVMSPTYINDEIIQGLQEGNRVKVYNEIKDGLGFPDIAELFGKE